MKRTFLAALLVTTGYLAGDQGRAVGGDAKPNDADRLVGSYRFERSGWIHVHLQGSPDRIGYQHGYLLADEITDFLRVIKPYLRRRSQANGTGSSTVKTAEQMSLWPSYRPGKYQREIDGIVTGLSAKGVHVDRWDVVALNANQELPYYYVPWVDKKEGKSPTTHAPGNCSAIIATGSYTKDGRIVMEAQRLDQLCCRDAALEHHLRP